METAPYATTVSQLYAEVNRSFAVNQTALQPFAGLSLLHTKRDGFTENGGDAALSSGVDTMDTVVTTLGLRATQALQLGALPATLGGEIGWHHASGDTTAKTAMSLAGGSDFTVVGAPLARDTAVLRGSLDMAVSSSALVSVGYAGQFGDGGRNDMVQAKLKIAF